MCIIIIGYLPVIVDDAYMYSQGNLSAMNIMITKVITTGFNVVS